MRSGVFALAIWAVSAIAAAAETPEPAPQGEIVGNVVGLDANEIVVDLGNVKGASDGDEVELWRPLKLRHPVTGQTLTDRFRIGSLRLVQVRRTLALAEPEGKPTREPAVGDVVILIHHRAATAGPTVIAPVRAAEAQPVATPPDHAAPADHAAPTEHAVPTEHAAPASPGAAPAPDVVVSVSKGTDREARELSTIFDALSGSDPATRIGKYESYVRAHPTGRFARVLYEEAQALRQLFAQRARVEEASAMRVASFAPPQTAQAGAPLALTVELQGPAAGALLHYRHAGEVAYTSTPMVAAGPSYWTATIPSERVAAPRAQYFIEALNTKGIAEEIAGSAEEPLSIVVVSVPRPVPPRRGDATLSLVTDYADYNRLRGNDWASQTEGYFGLRFDDVGVRAVRSGFGVYRGVGGTLKDLDGPAHSVSPRLVGLTYGYLEGEFGVSPFVALIGRAVLGLGDDGVTGGGQFLLRLGNDKKTNLLLGGEFLGGVGLRSITELDWNTIERVPIVLRTEVTNQPAGASSTNPRPLDAGEPVSTGEGEVGARAIVQVGYRVVPSLVLALRGSYGGRTISHAGPGAGAGVTYTW